MFEIEHKVDKLVTADEIVIAVGDELVEHYDPTDVVTLAEMVGAGIVTVGDDTNLFAGDSGPSCYLGPMDDHVDTIRNAEYHLVIGVGFTVGREVQWEVFGQDGFNITHYSGATHGANMPPTLRKSKRTIVNAEAGILKEIIASISRVTSFSEPANIYSYSGEHPDPEITHLGTHETPPRVKRCRICHTLSNQTTEQTSDSGVVWQCPAENHRNHDRLETLFRQRHQLEEELCEEAWRRQAEKDRRKQNKTVEEGQQAIETKSDQEIERIKSKKEELSAHIETLREWFDGRFDDVVEQDYNFDETAIGTAAEFEPAKDGSPSTYFE